MSASLPLIGAAPHHKRLEDVRCKPAKAVKEIENGWRASFAFAVQRCFDIAGVSQKEAAALLNRDVAQLSRWMSGDERPLWDAIFSVERFQVPAVQAIAELAHVGVEIETVVRLRRQA